MSRQPRTPGQQKQQQQGRRSGILLDQLHLVLDRLTTSSLVVAGVGKAKRSIPLLHSPPLPACLVPTLLRCTGVYCLLLYTPLSPPPARLALEHGADLHGTPSPFLYCQATTRGPRLWSRVSSSDMLPYSITAVSVHYSLAYTSHTGPFPPTSCHFPLRSHGWTRLRTE